MELSADMPIISVLKTVIFKSLTKELTKTILTEHGYQSVPTLLVDMSVTGIGTVAMILLPKKRKS